MTSTGNAIVTRALKMLGVVGATETPDGTNLAEGLVSLQQMVDGWGIRRGLLYTVTRTAKTLTADTASYTIGTAGDIALARPDRIISAGLILDTSDDPTTEVPVHVTHDAEEWARVAQKGLSGTYVQVIYYDRAFSSSDLGTVNLWPVPSGSTTQLVIYTPTGVSQFADGTTSYYFPLGYLDAITISLTERIGMEGYGDRAMQRALALKDRAREARDWLILSNVSFTELQMPAGLVQARGPADIRTNGY